MKYRYKQLFLLVILGALTISMCGCKSKSRSESLENRDYAKVMTVTLDQADTFTFGFDVADLTDYKGDSERLLNTEHYEYMAKSLKEATCLYYDENEHQLDLGHIEKITIDDERLAGIKDYYEEKEARDDEGMIRNQDNETYESEIIYEMDNSIFDVIREMGNMPDIAKSVEVIIAQSDNDEASEGIILRDLIKAAYAGENF